MTLNITLKLGTVPPVVSWLKLPIHASATASVCVLLYSGSLLPGAWSSLFFLLLTNYHSKRRKQTMFYLPRVFPLLILIVLRYIFLLTVSWSLRNCSEWD